MDPKGAALAWQVGVWDQMAAVYQREIDSRFAGVIEAVIRHTLPRPGEQILDLGTGTGSAALMVAPRVLPGGSVMCVDVSLEMLAIAARRAEERRFDNVNFREGRGESLPADSGSMDAIVASLSLMFAIDREQAAREIARVLRPGGRLTAAVWAGPNECDIVRFQQIAGGFAPAPPVPGVGPGALANPGVFLGQLAAAGIRAQVASEQVDFDFPTFDTAWDVLAGVTAASLSAEQRNQARAAIQADMWDQPNLPRKFRNLAHFITGTRI